MAKDNKRNATSLKQSQMVSNQQRKAQQLKDRPESDKELNQKMESALGT